MKRLKYTWISICFLSAMNIHGQDSLNMTRVGQWDPPGMVSNGGVTYNDIWGYTTPTGEEYAIIGNVDSILIVDVTNCDAPVRVYGFDGGNTTTWRDIKTYGTYVYSVCDNCTEGLHIFDMSALPGGAITHELSTTEFFEEAHNIYIDTTEQKLYATGSDAVKEGFVILDLSTPDDPTLVAEVELDEEAGLPSQYFYVHDVFVQNDTAYASHGNLGYFVWDLSDLNNIEILGQIDSDGYNHSSWINSNGSHSYFAEEVPTGLPMSVVDLSNLGDPILDIEVTSTFQHSLGSTNNSTAHNPFVKNDTMYISYYEDGIKVYDVTSPATPVLIGYYDTYPDNGNVYTGYKGAWGTYPFFDSGCICVSDIKYGLNTMEYCQVLTYYEDADGDGFGNQNVVVNDCSAPPGYVTDKTDCDDNNSTVYPGATEVCDGEDNNCDGQVDEGLIQTYYSDTDGDGYGDIGNSYTGCSAPSGFVTDSTDCDDNDSTVFPGANEACDGMDNDCDGAVDEGVQQTYYADTDGDGYGDNANSVTDCTAPSGYVTDNTDCDDSEASVYPNATEACDGIDNDCDGMVDENCALSPCDSLNLYISAIYQDTFRAKQVLDSDAMIATAQDIVYNAGDEIILHPDFEVAIGAEFLAEIRDCDISSAMTSYGPEHALAIMKEAEKKTGNNNYVLYSESGEILGKFQDKKALLKWLKQTSQSQEYMMLVWPR